MLFFIFHLYFVCLSTFNRIICIGCSLGRNYSFSPTPRNSVVLSWSSTVLLAKSLFLHFVHRSLEARITSSALFVFLPFGSKEELKNTPRRVFPMLWNKRATRWKCYSLKICKTFQLQLNLGFLTRLQFWNEGISLSLCKFII